MPIPDTQRVIYNNTPLESVICQLRFPPILKIDSVLPTDFQEKIRTVYPLFEETERKFPIPQGLPKILGNELTGKLGLGPKSYNFKTADEKWTVALTREFIALSTVDYQQWENFREKFLIIFNALNEIYKPSFFIRVGLRYRDVIRRSKIGLSTEEDLWAGLLNPLVIGALGSPDLGTAIEEFSNNLVVKLENGNGLVRIRHGLAEAKDNKEECYLIDCDYFSDDKTEVNNVIQRLDRFNGEERKFFRWCINDKLHQAMDPTLP